MTMLTKRTLFAISLFALLFTGAFLHYFHPDSAMAALPAPGNELGNNSSAPANDNRKLPLYLFWGDGCAHCEDEKQFLEKIKVDYPQIEILSFEVWHNKKNYQTLLEVSRRISGHQSSSVPFTVIGNEYMLGYKDDATSGAEIRQLLDLYIAQSSNSQPNEMPMQPKATIKYPLLGILNLKTLSLPILTAALGTLDGFNPCSMWALVVLITLLINSGSKKKMWLVGWVFILTSAFSYFIYMTAWFALFSSLGAIRAVQTAISILAITLGAYFLYDWFKKRKQSALVCAVAPDKTKATIIRRLKNALTKNSVWLMIAGVILVTWSVNAIEFMCSAGIPTIYTGILAQNNLPTAGYYAYLGLYDFFYMLDDMVVLLIAAFTWKIFTASGKYTQYSRLLGGILILILGIIMLVSPRILMFG